MHYAVDEEKKRERVNYIIIKKPHYIIIEFIEYSEQKIL